MCPNEKTSQKYILNHTGNIKLKIHEHLMCCVEPVNRPNGAAICVFVKSLTHIPHAHQARAMHLSKGKQR